MWQISVVDSFRPNSSTTSEPKTQCAAGDAPKDALLDSPENEQEAIVLLVHQARPFRLDNAKLASFKFVLIS
jgi:hypothetical protein